MAIAYRAAASAINGSVITKPAGVVDGDLMLAFVCVGDLAPPTIGAPAGWAQIGTTHVGNNAIALFWKVASGEGSTFTFTRSGSAYRDVYFIAFSGSFDSTPIETHAFINDTTSATNIDCPAVTPTVDNTVLVLGTWLNDTWTHSTTSPAATERLDTDGGYVGHRAGPASGVSSGVTNITISSSGQGDTWTIAIKEAGGGGGDQTVTAQALDAAGGLGTATVTQQQFVEATGLDAGSTPGTPTVSQELQIVAQSLDAAGGVGSPDVVVVIQAQAVASGVAIGQPSLEIFIVATGLDASGGVGTPTVQPGARVVEAQAVASGVVLGTPTVSPGGADVVATGVDAAGEVGYPIVTGGEPPAVVIGGRSRMNLVG